MSRDATTGALTTPEPVLNGRSPQRPDLAGPLDSALAAQAMFPVTNPVEMRGTAADPTNELAGNLDNPTIWARLMARLVGTNEGTRGGVEEYRRLFRAAIPEVATLDALTFGHAAKAIASFERTLAFNDQAPLDAYVRGNSQAISEAAKRGALLFTGKGRCAACHTGPLLSDRAFHVIAAPQLGPGEGGEPNDDRGRALITGNRRDDYEFRTPTLRNVALTAPYFHAGAYPNLPTVVDHYRDPTNHLLFYDAPRNLPPEFQGDYRRDLTKDQARLARVSPVIGAGVPLTLEELPDVVAFLEALTDPRAAQLTAPGSVPSGLPVD